MVVSELYAGVTPTQVDCVLPEIINAGLEIVGCGKYIYSVGLRIAPEAEGNAIVRKHRYDTLEVVGSHDSECTDGVAIHHDGEFLYAAFASPSKVIKYDTETMLPVATFTPSGVPFRITSDADYLYVGMSTTLTKIYKIDKATMLSVDTYENEVGSSDVAGLVSDGVKLYAAINQAEQTEGVVIRINPATMELDGENAIYSHVLTLNIPYHLHFDGEYLFYTLHSQIPIRKINPANMHLVCEKSVEDMPDEWKTHASLGNWYSSFVYRGRVYVGSDTQPAQCFIFDKDDLTPLYMKYMETNDYYSFYSLHCDHGKLYVGCEQMDGRAGRLFSLRVNSLR